MQVLKLAESAETCWNLLKLAKSSANAESDENAESAENIQKIYGLYARKHHLVEMRGGVTDAGRTTTTNNWR